MKVVYDETPEQMVAGVAPILDAGARILGACCGSTPDTSGRSAQRWTPTNVTGSRRAGALAPALDE